MANQHGGARPGAGRPSWAVARVQDVTENVLALVHQIDADTERLTRSVRMLRAYAVAVTRDLDSDPTSGELRQAA